MSVSRALIPTAVVAALFLLAYLCLFMIAAWRKAKARTLIVAPETANTFGFSMALKIAIVVLFAAFAAIPASVTYLSIARRDLTGAIVFGAIMSGVCTFGFFFYRRYSRFRITVDDGRLSCTLGRDQRTIALSNIMAVKMSATGALYVVTLHDGYVKIPPVFREMSLLLRQLEEIAQLNLRNIASGKSSVSA
jgi:hypothetical protein